MQSTGSVVRSPFKEQIVLGLDVCEKVLFARDKYDRLLTALGHHPVASLLPLYGAVL